MYLVTISDSFSAAHNLKDYEGKCENLHGHNWQVEVSVSAKKLNRPGMVLDFKRLKNILAEVLAGLDHQYLNQLPYFDKVNPTSENMAKFIHSRISKRLSGKQLKIEKVSVWETPTSCATYQAD